MWATGVPSAPPAFSAFASGVIVGRLSKLVRESCLVDGMAEEVFDGLEFILFLFADKGDRRTVRLGARGTADPVDIVFTVVRDVVVDHHFYVVYIDPAGEDIGSDQDGQTLAFELNHHVFAGGLVEIGVDLIDVEF
jgi:hypothetical protein